MSLLSGCINALNERPFLQRKITEQIGYMDRYFKISSTFQKTIFIDEIGDVYIPDNYTVEEIKLLGEKVLDGKASIDCLKIKKNNFFNNNKSTEFL